MARIAFCMTVNSITQNPTPDKSHRRERIYPFPTVGDDGAVRRREQAPALRCHSEGAKRPWESKFGVLRLVSLYCDALEMY